jgi:hypothetical protein
MNIIANPPNPTDNDIELDCAFVFCGAGSSGSVVDSHLKVYGVERLQIADGSIMASERAGSSKPGMSSSCLLRHTMV